MKRSLIVRAFVLSAVLGVVGACGGGGAPGGSPGAGMPFLYAALHDADWTPPDGFCGTSRVEIVNLASNAAAGGFDLPDVVALSLAVAPGGSPVYVLDACGDRVLVYAPDGTKLDEVPVSYGAKDLVLSANGDRLYVATDQQLLVIDTSTRTVVGNVPTEVGDNLWGIALSPDGTTVACACPGSDPPAILLYSASPLALLGRVPFPLTGGGCWGVPGDVAFTDTGRVLAWDSGCDSLHQVNVATRTYLDAARITYADDGAQSDNINNAIFYVPAVARAFGFKESGEAVISDPAAASGATILHLGGAPRVPAPNPAGTGVYYSIVRDGLADGLALLDTATGNWQYAVYEFSDATKRVRDMRVVLVPSASP